MRPQADSPLPPADARAWHIRVRSLPVELARLNGYNHAMAAKHGQRTRGRSSKPRDAVQEAIAYGIDVAALRDNLARTPAERLRRHQIALNTVEMLQKAKRT